MSGAQVFRRGGAGAGPPQPADRERGARGRAQFDACVVGHVTRDLVRTGASGTTQVGGTAYYSALALRALGATVAVVTRCAREDVGELLGELHSSGASVHWRASVASSMFENTYAEYGSDARRQHILAAAEPLGADDIPSITARAVHLGPLTDSDMDAAFAAALLQRVGNGADVLVSLDVQGLVRTWQDRQGGDPRELVRLAHIVKADPAEAAALTGATDPDTSAAQLLALGPVEVLITRGSRGSVLYTADGRREIAPVSANGPIVDRTGCGDTYAAAYLLSRLRGRDPVAAANVASAAAAAKLNRRGALRAVPGEPGY